jgi:hypothetical protein
MPKLPVTALGTAVAVGLAGWLAGAVVSRRPLQAICVAAGMAVCAAAALLTFVKVVLERLHKSVCCYLLFVCALLLCLCFHEA